MFDSVRVRLTLWYTCVLALVLIVFAITAYILVARTLTRRTDEGLSEMTRAFSETLKTELQEVQAGDKRVSPQSQRVLASNDAAVAAATSEYRLKDYQFIVYDGARRIVASSNGFLVELQEPSAPVWTRTSISSELSKLLEATQAGSAPVYATLSDGDDRFRTLAQTLQIGNGSYTFVVMHSLDEQEDLLERAGAALLVGVPLALLIASLGGYFLARKSLAPVVQMGETASRIGASNLHERLPVVNDRDELGSLAKVFNKLLARLNESFEQQRRFMADASHELRTPVAIVRGEAEVSLSRDERPAEDYRESLAIVHDEGRRLTRIVEDLFTLTRSDAGRQTLNLTDFYLDETVVECVRSLRTIAAARGLTLALKATDELPFNGDEEAIRQMLINLLDNAIKYTRPGGLVSVECKVQVDEFVLTVRDTGTGIPVESQPHIFERFYRADKARSRSANGDENVAAGSGAGLGLAIARLLTEAHGGRLDLLHSDEGGSIFVAALPRHISNSKVNQK